MKTPMADAFREWHKNATKEEKQRFCDDANALAAVLRNSQFVGKDTVGEKDECDTDIPGA